MYSEIEASTKWCPHVRIPQGFKGGDNSAIASANLDEGSSNRCIASDCMMWRWQPLMADKAFEEAVKKAAIELNDKHPQRFKSGKHVLANREKYGLPENPTHGYCGLAGGFLT